MKKSNLILLALVLVLCGTFVTLAIALRVKIDHHDYRLEKSDATTYGEISLGTFSVIEADDLYALDVKEGDHNAIGLPVASSKEVSYTLVGDTLKLRPNGENRARVRLTVRDLRACYVHEVDNCVLTGLKGDSLYFLSRGGSVNLDSAVLGSLSLRLSGGLTLSNTACRNLWLDMDSTAQLNLEKDRLGIVRGRWNEQAGLQVDGTTLAGGIQKIEHIQ